MKTRPPTDVEPTEDLEWGNPSPETAISTAAPRRHRHVYEWPEWRVTHNNDGTATVQQSGRECRCGDIQDPAASRRGRLNRSRGLAAQRKRLRAIGIENIPGNGPYDGRSEMFRAEHKSGGAFPKTLWRYLKGIPVTTETAILVVTDTPGPGHKARSVVIIDADDWRDLHGGGKQ